MTFKSKTYFTQISN